MCSNPSSSGAQPTLSTRKRSAATEPNPDAVVDLDPEVSGAKSETWGCLPPKRHWWDANSPEIRNLLQSKRQPTTMKEKGKEVFKAKGGGGSSGCGCSSSNRRVPDEGMDQSAKKKESESLPWWYNVDRDGEEGYQHISGFGDDNEIGDKVNNLKEGNLSTLPCQLFVNVGGSHFSLQENLNKTSANMLVNSVFQRMGSKSSDFYCTCSGKYLEGEKLLSFYPIQRDSTINVQHRLRAGRIHIRGFSLNGSFSAANILFHKGSALFDDKVPELRFNPDRGRNDLAKLHDIFRPVFYDETMGDFALHAEHLLDFIFKCPAGVDLTSLAVVAFLTNHYALQTFVQRISTCNNLDSMIERLTGAAFTYFKNNIGVPPDWRPIKDVPAMNDIYIFGRNWDARNQKWVLAYSQGRGACVHLARNFFKHAPKHFSREEIEAAFSVAMSAQNLLPNMLQQIAVLNPPLPAPDFDIVNLLGNNIVQ